MGAPRIRHQPALEQGASKPRRAPQGHIEPENYRDLSYYEGSTAATERLLVEKNILTREKIDERAAEIERRWSGP